LKLLQKNSFQIAFFQQP